MISAWLVCAGLFDEAKVKFIVLFVLCSCSLVLCVASRTV